MGVMPLHEGGALFGRHRLIGDLRQRFEVLFARCSGGEEKQHRRGIHTPEAMYAAFRHEEKVAGMRSRALTSPLP